MSRETNVSTQQRQLTFWFPALRNEASERLKNLYRHCQITTTHNVTLTARLLFECQVKMLDSFFYLKVDKVRRKLVSQSSRCIAVLSCETLFSLNHPTCSCLLTLTHFPIRVNHHMSLIGIYLLNWACYPDCTALSHTQSTSLSRNTTVSWLLTVSSIQTMGEKRSLRVDPYTEETLDCMWEITPQKERNSSGLVA